MYDCCMVMFDDGAESDIGPTVVEHEMLIAEIAGHLNVQNGRLVAVMADVLSDRSWVGTGIHTPTQWLAWKAGISPERARSIVQVAEKRADFPVVVGELERGELTLDQVAVVVTKAPTWADPKVVDFAKEATVHQLRRTITDQFFDDGPPPAEPPTEPPVDRLSFGSTTGDRWRINGNFDIATGRRIEAALTERKDSLFERGETDATWADALVEMAETSLDAVPSESRRDRYRTWLHVDVSKGSTTTTDGWCVPMAVRERLLCDGTVQPVWERDGLPFSVGRAQRIVPDRTRRIIERRDRGCRVPGCTAARFVEVHHILHWLHGGTSDTGNLLSLCGKHHRQHHQGELGVSGDADAPDGMVFTDVHGRVIGGSGRPKVPEADADPPPARFVPVQANGWTTATSRAGSPTPNSPEGPQQPKPAADNTDRPDSPCVAVPVGRPMRAISTADRLDDGYAVSRSSASRPQNRDRVRESG